MPLITWEQAYAVGHPEIDDDHRRVLELINDLDAAVAADEPAEAVAAGFAALSRHVAEHFAREERVMAERGYPDLAAHRQEHRRLAADFESFRGRFLAGARAGMHGRELMFLATWWVSHIVRSDMRSIPWIARD